MAQPPSSNAAHSVYVGGLPLDVAEAQLFELFAAVGKVTRVEARSQ